MAEQITGWARPAGAASFHFFMPAPGNLLLESACARAGSRPWFFDPSDALEASRALHDAENCLGCRAWLSIRSNRVGLAAEVAV